MDIIIRGWEEKFEKIAECLREVQLTSERASSDMCLVGQEARAQSHEHDRRLAEFLRKFENIDALRASTPRRFPDFGYQTSPVGREEVAHPHSTLPHFESACTEEEEDAGESRNTLPHTSSARTGEQISFRDTRTRDAGDSRNTLPHTTCCSGTRAPGIKTTISGTRATESRTTLGTRAPYNFVLMIDLHTMTTNGIAQRHTATHRFHARHRVLKFRHSMDLILPNFALG